MSDFPKISLTNVDFPLPDTPVTTLNFPKGNFTLIFFKLCSLAPLTSKNNPFPLRRFLGTSIFSFPDKYFPVIEFSQSIISSGVPAQITCPP